MRAEPPVKSFRRVLCGLAALLVCVAVSVGLCGCKYSTGNLLRDDIRTVYIPVFKNDTFFRGLEVELTRAVVNEIKLHTRMRIAPRDEADSVIEGELVEFEQRSVIRNEDDEIVLKRLAARVRFRWVDNLTLQDIVPSRTVSETETVAAATAGQVEGDLFRELAKAIVENMAREW